METTRAKQRQHSGTSASRDVGDRLVGLEHLRDRHTTLWAKIVETQAVDQIEREREIDREREREQWHEMVSMMLPTSGNTK